ncbi:polyphosphate kinase 2 [Rhodobacteraceae bacterium MBR-64]
MTLPFDGAISRYVTKEAPKHLRDALRKADKNDMLSESFPYRTAMNKGDYEDAMERLQIELVKYQAHLRDCGARVVVVFEGRDASGKGGTIGRLRENINPRGAPVVALPKPSDTEATQWYFQRYIARMPAAGEMVIFDRSWYNRGVVEPVFGFCTLEQRAKFFRQVPRFEAMLVEDGIRLVKIWLNVGRAEQMRRFLDREKDPLKHWKLSRIDVDGLPLWDAYTDAIRETLLISHTQAAPWTVIRADDKRRARLAAIRAVLGTADYPGRDAQAVGAPDPLICGGPEIWPDIADA